ncbi:AAA family ATPase [Nostoc sp. CHAB 5834]|nr:AAA family ATPase [Nostoc sp. CHAB 5834]
MFLRTQCDRELYLSLFKANADILKASGIPVPLKSRPGVQIITTSGREFEREQFDELIRTLPGHVIFEPGYVDIDPVKALTNAPVPSLVLQPQIEPEAFREFALNNLGLTLQEQDYIPKMAGLRPDVLLIKKAKPGDYEILVNGSRRRVEDAESRLAISVIDLKNVTEANPSYAAEVCLYAFFLANWLAGDTTGIKEKYFVCDRLYLWKHLEMPRFQRALTLKGSTSAEKRIDALVEDLEEGIVDYLIYMPSVRKFFKEDLPRVVSKGDAYGWNAVSYHVNSRCNSCDWLGNTDWLLNDELQHYKDNPEHYCFYSADAADHLCKMSGLSKGASQILINGGHTQIAHLVGILGTDPILKKHAFLKRDKSQIGERATALSTGNITVDKAARISGLAKEFNAEYDIIVNFDAGSGLLTGIAIRAILFAPFEYKFISPDGSERNERLLGEEAFVVPKDNEQAEWVIIQSFIEKLASWSTEAQSEFNNKGWGNVRTQICFWEIRQYEELCNAFGRHLLRVLSLRANTQKALAWIFPSEDLMEQSEHLVPGIVFIRDIVNAVVCLPVKFCNTLLGVVERYHYPRLTPRQVDKYYREPLGDGIPRERIFEIWKCTTGTVTMYGRPASIVEAIQKYGSILKAQAWALGSITAQLRVDLKTGLKGKAPQLRLSVPQGARNVAKDSQLWIKWDQVSVATAITNKKAELITKGESLEASYKAIVLTKLISQLGGNNRYEFEVSDESTEAKLEEGGSFYVLGIMSNPGFPQETGRSVGISINHPEIDFAKLNMPMHKVIAVTLESFDRVGKKATIAFRPRNNWIEPIFNEVFEGDYLPIHDEPLYLLEGLPYDDSDITEKILRAVGDPACAKAAPEALAAMGRSGAKVPLGTDPITPIARVLWEANTLASQPIRDDAHTQVILDFAASANKHPLNASQQDAIRACAKNKLSVIWGPPGTGKTDTLVALLHALVFESQSSQKSRKILITGPNYRAVEELVFRLLNNLNNDTRCIADVFVVYSQSREPKTLPDSINPHLDAKSIRLNLKELDNDSLALRASLTNLAKVTITATTAHLAQKISELIYSEESASPIQEIFDFIVIDESSQVPVTLAMRPLSTLKENGQLVVAGDHLQMPPIFSLEPPKNAEYLVGSIQTYILKRFMLPTQELLVNYRSNQDLVDYAKTLGYPPKLQAYNLIKQIRQISDLDAVIAGLPESLPKTTAYKELLSSTRTVTAFIHEDTISSQANELEAKLVAGLAYCLRYAVAKELFEGNDENTFTSFSDEEFFEFGIGIVTPHKAQKALVIKELQKLFPEAAPNLILDAVDTVERFQGGQRQTVIVSFGVGDTEIIAGEEQFLLQLERTNVAVSRAMAKCIILMTKALAYHLPTDQKAAKTAIGIKSYIEEFCNNYANVTIENNSEVRSAEVRWH